MPMVNKKDCGFGTNEIHSPQVLSSHSFRLSQSSQTAVSQKASFTTNLCYCHFNSTEYVGHLTQCIVSDDDDGVCVCMCVRLVVLQESWMYMYYWTLLLSACHQKRQN